MGDLRLPGCHRVSKHPIGQSGLALKTTKFVKDAAALKRIYQQGPEALSSDERKSLVERLEKLSSSMGTEHAMPLSTGSSLAR